MFPQSHTVAEAMTPDPHTCDAYDHLENVSRRMQRLKVGAFPVLGNLAYPSQIVVSGVGDRIGVARFLLHDWCAALGRAIPFWGGRDTAPEHAAVQSSERP